MHDSVRCQEFPGEIDKIGVGFGKFAMNGSIHRDAMLHCGASTFLFEFRKAVSGGIRRVSSVVVTRWRCGAVLDGIQDGSTMF